MPDTPIPLREVRVLLVRPEVEPQWNALLHVHHYLGFRKLCGAQLKQVAVWGNRWLALLGWPPWQRHTRLHLIANQSRFLRLPSAGHTPRLASCVLGLSLRRLPADWRASTGRRLLLAETFAGPARFAGTCYRAANWLPVGTQIVSCELDQIVPATRSVHFSRTFVGQLGHGTELQSLFSLFRQHLRRRCGSLLVPDPFLLAGASLRPSVS